MDMGMPFLDTSTQIFGLGSSSTICEKLVNAYGFERYLHQGLSWLARDVEHEVAIRVDVGEAACIRNSKLRGGGFLTARAQISGCWEPLVADEIALDRGDKQHFFLDFVLRIQPKVDENLRVVLCHSLLLG